MGALCIIIHDEFGLVCREATSCALLVDTLQFINSDDSHVAVHVGVGPLVSPQSIREDVLGGTLSKDIPISS
jgi:hypothetical protein